MKMRVAFLTEMSFQGKIPADHPNMRTEFAWMHAMDADHHCIRNIESVKNYHQVFIIFPKGRVFLSAEGTRLSQEPNPVSDLLKSNFLEILKHNNEKVHFVQEGPHWWYNDYEVIDQILFYNLIAQCDSIFAHNEYDVSYYKGLFPTKPVHTIPTLMVETLIKDIVPSPEKKVIIGGNFARWYGGFESFIVAESIGLPVFAQTSHAKREQEGDLGTLRHLPRFIWIDWMKTLSKFKYAVHLMPTVAAGTFALNCAYFGIPCIGNQLVDTQRLCFPDLSVDVADVDRARALLSKLKDDKEFYKYCSAVAKENYNKYYSLSAWTETITKAL